MGASISSLVFQAPGTTLLNAERRERVWLETIHKVTIPAFFIDRGAPITVLFSHGNAEDLGAFVHPSLSVAHALTATHRLSHRRIRIRPVRNTRGCCRGAGMIYDWFKSFSAVLKVNVSTPPRSALATVEAHMVAPL